MRTSIIMWIVIIILVILGGWFLWSIKNSRDALQSSMQAANIQSYDQNGKSGAASTVAIATDPELGSHLVAANGMTLYFYANDKPNLSNCSSLCATNWPPYSPPANVPLVSGSGIVGELGTITRDDNLAQLTYKGMPLYFWKNDKKPGDVTGQNMQELWFVVKP